MSILTKIEKAGLIGCGGACFPTATKWKMVKEAVGKTKYVIANASEGEPNVEKDGYIFDKYPKEFVGGMKLAMDFLAEKNVSVKGFIFINSQYYKKYGKKIKKEIDLVFSDSDKNGFRIDFFVKPHESGYIGGEETALLETMEGKRTQPRLKPPFPTTEGLWRCPTLINNVETFYHANEINESRYKQERFFSINGEVKKKGVYKFPGNWTIEKVLKESGNLPVKDFFVQVGGGGSGEVLNSKQLKKPASGAMSITVHDLAKHKPRETIRKWIYFFVKESCGQCTICREGTSRLLEIFDSAEPDWNLFSDVLNSLTETSLCALGCTVPIPLKTYAANVLSTNDLKIDNNLKKTICECFK